MSRVEVIEKALLDAFKASGEYLYEWQSGKITLDGKYDLKSIAKQVEKVLQEEKS